MERTPKKQRDLSNKDIFKLATVGRDIERVSDDMASVKERIARADQVIAVIESKLSDIAEPEQSNLRAEVNEWKIMRADMTENLADYQRICESAKLLRRRYLDDMLS